MNIHPMSRKTLLIGILTLGLTLAPACFSGQPRRWEEVPEAVRATILANGGVAGLVDKESEKINGKTVYEASVRKNGKVLDLVVIEDGKLIETKNDDAADKAKEDAEAAKPAPPTPKFSHPRDITNPWLPLASLKQDILEGKEDGKTVRVERTAKPDLHKTFKVGGQTVETLVFEDREFEDGKIAEVTMDYFAQADDGTVYYLGEDVDTYEDGKITGHEGAWLFGKDTKKLDVLFPAHPKVGDQFKSEDVSKTISELDEIISVSETVTTPLETYKNCVKIKELYPDGSIEYKYFAPGVGCVRENPAEGDVLLKSHETKDAK
jgi:hypothetical protein